MNKLLVPVDFSPASEAVIAQAVALARLTESRLLLLHVVQPPVVVSSYGLMLENAMQLTQASEKDAAQRLQRMKVKLVARGLATETLLRTGSPATHILEEARRSHATFIVIGSHGHTAFFDLLIGSTTSAVIKRSKCPVLVVPVQVGGKPAKAAQL